MTSTVLTVEDDPAIRALISSVLEAEDLTVCEATDGIRAAGVARECDPDVILLDIGLPGQDGFQVLDELKADEALKEIPVLMVTAWADPELVARAMDRGAVGYIRKPFDINDLRDQVVQTLAGTRGYEAPDQRPGFDQLVADARERWGTFLEGLRSAFRRTLPV